ncbi:putative ATPase/DNA-binding SARP family transcriptional activator [Cryobacterium sp. MP_M5]|uniref:BTAD domain-containing putative transcriptional regulator n=1 Tax=unclassified Cryobacterium TaxID=2649013 RepID=UPI0018C9454B|nr:MULTISPECIES: BTAD domain-containing putative transcriptional regulator [unclassified Cryobacterium]MBG6057275.1 putative ATPase/DNA-binding SARP family transcriptional activator [Cryobacterium sp. MP_M3]MEC5175474.1 putative ATPase/DNA-binding SARP family transcriptional activator [Cryobacterium sp. MP_M5]
MFVHLLGIVSTGADVASLRPVGGRVPSAVLAHLALAEGKVVALESLMDCVWDDPPPSARNAIQVAVSGLRKRCGADLIDGGRDGYRLRAGMLRVDSNEAADLLLRGRQMFGAGRFGEARSQAATALTMFDGEPLAGLTTMRAEQRREQLLRLRQELVTVHSAALLELGRPGEAIADLRGELESDPLNETIHALLMRVLAADGRASEALEHYGQLRHRLADELGTDPSALVSDVFSGVLAGTVGVVIPAPIAMRTPNNSLPSPASPLVGRDEDMRGILSRLRDGHRLVTLIGPGGIGKTRLAIEAARISGDDDARPVTFVDLSTARTASEVDAVVANTLGVAADEVAASVAGTRMLVVLDNAEHVLEAVLELVPRLLAVAGVSVLVTSRSPLRLVGEFVIDLDGLEPGPATRLLADRVGFSPAEKSRYADELAVLVQRSDGIPLLLELIAPALHWSSPGEVVDSLGQVMAGLQDETRNRPSRHANISAVVEWSVLQAGEDARRALGVLGLIRGSFTEPTARALTAAGGGSSSSAGLVELVDLSLVKRLRVPGQIRFRILESVRLYVESSSHVAKPTVEDHRAHATHYLRALAAVHENYDARPDDFDDMARVEDANITQALTWALVEDRPLAIRHLDVVLWGWCEGGRHRDLQVLATAVLGGTEGTELERARVAVCYLVSTTDEALPIDGSMRAARDLAQASAEQFDDAWHRRWIIAAVGLRRLDGDLEGAFDLAGGMRRNSARSRGVAESLRAMLLLVLGRTQEALEHARLALAEVQAVNRSGRVFELCNVGYCCLVLEEYEEARTALTEAILIADETELVRGLAAAELNLAWVELQCGDPSAALGLVVRNLAGHRGQADWAAFSEALVISALALAALGDLATATDVATAAIPRVTSMPNMSDTFITGRVTQLCETIGYVESASGTVDAIDDARLLEMIRNSPAYYR